MTARDRVKRPVPERTEPIRNWGTLFGRQAWSGTAASPTDGPSVRGESRHSQATADPISSGVQAGYRVIDEYVRQGQSAARLAWGPVSGASPGNGGDDLQQRFGAMMRSATDLATLWLELMAGAPGAARAPWPSGAAFWQRQAPPADEVSVPPFSADQAAAAPTPAPPPSHSAPQAAAGGDNTAVSIDVVSTRRTEVILDLKPRSADHPLRVHDLRAADPDAPRLSGVVVEGVPGEDRIIVRLRVPATHPPGLYSGLILDDRTSLPRGTLAVRISAEAGP